MDGLLRFAQREGLTEEEAQKTLRLNRPVTEGGWVDAEDMGSESLLIAKAGMKAGRYLEYTCYESTGGPSRTGRSEAAELGRRRSSEGLPRGALRQVLSVVC